MVHKECDINAMKTAIPVMLLALGLLSGCESGKPVGADRDSHGCLPSGGYQWCPATATCERSWELAEAKGFANAPAGFEAFCAGANVDQ